MRSEAIIYVPSDTPEAMNLATRKVAGVPLVIRNVMTLHQAGVRSITILSAKSQIHKIRSFLHRYKDSARPNVVTIAYDEPYRVSPKNIDDIISKTTDEIILINSNLLYYPELIKLSLKFTASTDEFFIVKKGKSRLPFLKINRSLLIKARDYASSTPVGIESVISFIKGVGKRRELSTPDEFDIFLPAKRKDIEVAERFLTEHIRHATDGIVAKKINKRVSLPVSLLLSRLWIHPNSITIFNMLIGVFSGVFIADGTNYWVILIGAILFQLASIVDGCDGEVAKLTFRTSKFGQYLDTISDNLTLGSLMTGLIAGYWRQTHNHIAFYLGSVMVIGVATLLFFMGRFLKQNTDSASLVTYDKEFIQKLSTSYSKILLGFINIAKYTIKKDVYSFVVLILAAFGKLYYWLYVCALGAVIAAAIVIYLDYSERSRVNPKNKVQKSLEGLF